MHRGLLAAPRVSLPLHFFWRPNECPPAPGTHRERATEGFPGVREREEKRPRKARDGRGRFLELPETFYPEGAYAQERLRQLQESPPLGTSRAAGAFDHAKRSPRGPGKPGPPSPIPSWRSPPPLREQRPAHDGPDRDESILEPDLLALGVVPPGIRDRHLIDAHAHLGDLGRDLGLHGKRPALDV